MKILFLNILMITTFSVQASADTDFIPASFRARFEQVYKGALRGKEKKSDGVIEYKFPGNIRVEITDPNESLIFVSNPKKSWFYRPPFIPGEPGELSIKPQGNVVVAKFFDTLKNGLKNNSKYKIKDSQNSKFDKIVVFTKESAKELGVKEALLISKKSKLADLTNIKSVELIYLDGKKVKLNFDKVESGVAFKSDRFIFEIPENTNITN